MSAVRHQLRITAPPRTVWSAFTTEEGVCRWWAPAARVDARPGGRLVLSPAPGADGEPRPEQRGMFHECRPTRRIEIAWDASSPDPITRGTRVQISLGQQGDETQVMILHSGEPLNDDATRSAIEAAWKADLLRLRAALEA
jgi:uncharacterized protein YndB with AHSA1/START domain